MDASEVKLTTRQKIVPLLRAINKEIPWQMVLFLLFIGSLSIYLPSFVPSTVAQNGFWIDFFVRRVMLGLFVFIVSFFFFGFIVAAIMDFIAPIFKRIKNHYEDTSLEAKKKVLENVIEDEILLK